MVLDLITMHKSSLFEDLWILWRKVEPTNPQTEIFWQARIFEDFSKSNMDFARFCEFKGISVDLELSKLTKNSGIKSSSSVCFKVTLMKVDHLNVIRYLLVHHHLMNSIIF